MKRIFLAFVGICVSFCAFSGDYPQVFTKEGDIFAVSELSVAITQLVISVHGASEATTRRIMVEPGRIPVEYSAEESEFKVNFPLSALQNSFSLVAYGGGVGNVYVTNVEVLGVPLNILPSAVAVTIPSDDRCEVRFRNPAGATADKITLYKLSGGDITLETPINCDFSSLTNTAGNPLSVTNCAAWNYPEIEGKELFLPSHSQGILQCGVGDRLGTILLQVCDNYQNAVLQFSVKRCANDEYFMPVSYVVQSSTSPGQLSTNQLTSVLLPTNNFETYEINLSDLPANARILLNAPQPNNAVSNKRVWFQSIKVIRRKVGWVRYEEISSYQSSASESMICDFSLTPQLEYQVGITVIIGNDRSPEFFTQSFIACRKFGLTFYLKE